MTTPRDLVYQTLNFASPARVTRQLWVLPWASQNHPEQLDKIRTDFPDVFELLLGLAGTLTVYNANGTQELRHIPHVMFLPMVRRRLTRILEVTAVTPGQAEDEEDEENP